MSAEMERLIALHGADDRAVLHLRIEELEEAFNELIESIGSSIYTQKRMVLIERAWKKAKLLNNNTS